MLKKLTVFVCTFAIVVGGFFISRITYKNTCVAQAQVVETGTEEQLDHALSVYNDGTMAVRKGEKEKANELYTQAFDLFFPFAKQGVAKAQWMVGLMKEFGEGTSQDYVVAVEWYRRAAEQGHPGAQRRLGESYYEGQGVLQDYTVAFSWYRKSSEQGYWSAQIDLAEMYEQGLGVTQDLVFAYMWYDVALPLLPSDIFKAEVIRIRDELAKEMTPIQIREAQKLSNEWSKKFKKN